VVDAVDSSRLWQADLPAGLTPGLHRIEVLATDEYSREHAATPVLEVTES
jgi:hypothetical protein